jgi:Flp pilus assembly protein CpaB
LRRRRLFRRSPLPFWVLTLGLAAGTGLFVARLVDEASAAATRYGRLRAVPVVVRPVQAGQVVGPADVARRSVPAAFVPAGEVTGDAAGRVALVPLVPGEVLLQARLAPWGLRGAAALLPPGTRALAVPAGPGGRPPLQPGDRVDVLATFEHGEAEGARPTFAVASGALVVHVDDDDETVTVAVPAGDAPRLAFALTAASVTLALSAGPPPTPTAPPG